MATGITINNLVVHRGTFTLSVDRLDVRPGEIFAILGTTGSGKTVLVEAIAGAYRPAAGTILLDGHDTTDLDVQDKSLGILYQDYALFPHMSVWDNIAYGLKRRGLSPQNIHLRVRTILESFGIGHLAERYPDVISGGESQRVALARALVLEPSLLLLDEPFSALDPTTKRRMYDLVRKIHREFDCTIVFVTHDFSEAQALADRIGIILDGSLREALPASELFTYPHDEDVSQFLGLTLGCEIEQCGTF